MSDIAFNPDHVPLALSIGSSFILAGIALRALAGLLGRVLSSARRGAREGG
ncbi:MAG: hypothetical protein QM820_46555 [Minicystis sp.]